VVEVRLFSRPQFRHLVSDDAVSAWPLYGTTVMLPLYLQLWMATRRRDAGMGALPLAD